jgi:hypothetical protein
MQTFYEIASSRHGVIRNDECGILLLLRFVQDFGSLQ